MIKLANNLKKLLQKDNLDAMIIKYASLQKEALVGTTLSALLHGAAADHDEPLLREVLRGAVKGLGADAGILLGGLAGAYGAGSGGGSLLGAGAGGVGGYLLMDKLINRMGRKDKKAPAKLQT